jgi:hypothetical protein
MVELPRVISKKVWFLVFNTATIIYLVVSGSLHFEVDSILAHGLALLLINVVALISARKYKGWK